MNLNNEPTNRNNNIGLRAALIIARRRMLKGILPEQTPKEFRSSLMAFTEKNFDEIFSSLEKAEYGKTVEVVNKYLERKWLKQSEVDAYVGSGLILAKDVKK